MATNTRNRLIIEKSSRTKYEPNYQLILIVVFLLIFGLLMIFSSSAVIAYIYNGGDTFYFVKRQLLWIVVGIVVSFFFYITPMENLKKIGYLMTFVAIILMVITLPEAIGGKTETGFPKIDLPFVRTLNGATRWIGTESVFIQPSEIVKLGLVIFISAWFTLGDQAKKNIEKAIKKYQHNELLYITIGLLYRFLPFVLMGIIAILILAQKDLDTLVIIGLTFLSVYYVSGSGREHTIKVSSLLSLSFLGGLMAIFSEKYRAGRLNTFLQILLKGEPSSASKRDESFQVWNGLIALGTGGIFGVGYGESRQKLFFLQEAAYTDSIFTIIGEEFGLIGTLLVILGFLYFLSIGMKIAKNANNKYEALVAIGITSWIVIQAFLNIAANLAVIPFGGMPLPFLSYGGSNTLMIMAGVGILLNISKKKV